MSHFLYKWATLMERSVCSVIFFLLCIGAALVLVLGTLVAGWRDVRTNARAVQEESENKKLGRMQVNEAKRIARTKANGGRMQVNRAKRMGRTKENGGKKTGMMKANANKKTGNFNT